MSLPLIFASLVVAYLLVVVLQTVAVWVSSRWAEPGPLSWLRSLLVGAVIVGLCLGIHWVGNLLQEWLLEYSLGDPSLLVSALRWSVPLVSFLVQAGAVLLSLRWLAKTPWDQAGLGALLLLITFFAWTFLLNGALRVLLFEAFSVPTPGMAPAIRGVHAELDCPNCGCPYSVNMVDRWHSPGLGRRLKNTACPNCRQDGIVPSTAEVQLGDRILVDKWTRPDRWQAVVFRHLPKGTHAVARLVGLPGETVEIVAGDLFINGRRRRRDPETAPDMWVLVHDTQYQPARTADTTPRWQPGQPSSAWKQTDGQWTLAEPSAEPQVLEFVGPVEDNLMYNDRPPGRPPPSPLLGDVRLECWCQQCSGDGSLEVRWRYLGQQVTALISTEGDVEITSPDAARLPEQSSKPQGLLPGGLRGAGQWVFGYRDGQAYVASRGLILAWLPVGPQDVSGVKAHLQGRSGPCRVEIAARRCGLTFSRIALSRDVYYRNVAETPGPHAEKGYASTDRPLTLDEDACFMLGDNSLRSEDSRIYGPVPRSAVTGTARWIYWPPSRWRELH